MRLTIAFILLGVSLLPGAVVAESLESIPGITPREVRVLTRMERRAKAAKTLTLASQCSSFESVNFLIKADTSDHIPGGDARRGSYSVIGSSRNCRVFTGSGPYNILYANGNVAGKVGYYGQWSRSHGGNGCNRYYGGAGGAPAHSASGIISKSRKLKGKYLYLKKNGGTTKGVCYRWDESSRRVGSV
jgi:hypothetical protein